MLLPLNTWGVGAADVLEHEKNIVRKIVNAPVLNDTMSDSWNGWRR
jgi:hypothetical protein